MPEAQWYVVHTYAGYEDTVKKNLDQVIINRSLQELIHEVVIPTETVVAMPSDGSSENEENALDTEYEESGRGRKSGKGKKKDEKLRKKFPGYVFVKMVMNTDTWFIVRNTRGCTGFVGPDSNNPIPLTEQEVQKFIGGETVTVEVGYTEGETVKIVAGQMEGYIGYVDSIDTATGRVTLMVDMNGRDTPVELDLDQVVPLG